MVAKPRTPKSASKSTSNIVIPVMGATGSGKSYFINKLLEATRTSERVKVGLELASCTAELRPITIKGLTSGYSSLEERDVTIVDTPGFDDSVTSDFETIKRIATWLKKSFERGSVLGGVIYVHDISQDRFTGAARRNLDMFNHLCGQPCLKKVVILTTKWNRAGPRNLEELEADLRDKHWAAMIGKGAQTLRFDANENLQCKSALGVVDALLSGVAGTSGQELLEEVLQIQDELVNRKMSLKETKIAEALRTELEEIIEAETTKKGVTDEARLARARAQVKELWSFLARGVSTAFQIIPFLTPLSI
ncbi:P-loop containing nucleoside triphosphate hydrolase protein [Ephemerocybe angulata]|uniref:P-loop containing nucleoside triphosphate hydrolase protein n=1 Tax=Ephemerocybe angulata TaxID=980116 RepID=A0A8H6HCQ4_9AGAR|nr:P-loop containing nucleoside triphosphate hydrolase protein [Tulosesus angulatus]